jgi:cytochrome c oxidase cbb3-type subunit 3
VRPRPDLPRSPLAALAATLLLAAACHDESRRPREPATASEAALGTPPGDPGSATSEPLEPGPPTPPPDAGPSAPITQRTFDSPYDDNAWAISEGKRLFDWMNCSGCHAHGGGGIGPALMDGSWRYGSGDPQSIYVSIVEGRPKGMPSYRGRLGEADVWKLVAYVRTLSGRANHVAASGRNDSLRYKKPESLKDEEP